MIELLVVVAIIGILTAIAIPAYQNYQDEAKKGVTDSALQTGFRTVLNRKALNRDTVAGDIGATTKGAPVTFTVSSSDNSASILVNSGTWCLESTVSTGTAEPACINEAGKIFYKTPAGANCSGGNASPESDCPVGCTFDEGMDTSNDSDNTCSDTQGTCASGTCS